MSIKSRAILNWPLTSYAQGFMQDRLGAYRLANLLCPIVRVGAASGTFKKFDDRNSFLTVDTHRGVGGTAKRLKHEATDGTYNCEPHALEIPKDDFEADLAGMAGAVQSELLDQGKIRSLLSVKATSYAKRAVDFAIAGMTAVADRGNWTNNDVDPIDQIDEQLEALATDVSSTDNVSLILSIGVWRKLRSNTKVKSRLGVTGGLTLRREQLVDGLLFPVNLEVSSVSLTSTKFGQSTVTKTNIVGDYAILLFSTPNATINDPSAFKCFSTSDALVEAVRTYREESARSDIHAVDWSEHLVQTSTLSSRLLAIT